ncbi:MAG: hypothetical protein ACHQF2_02790 [Flavobacteriales bacterium]
MKKRVVIAVLLVFRVYTGLAQIELNKSVIFSGDSLHKRQVENVSALSDSLTLTSAQSVIHASHQLCKVNGVVLDSVVLTHPAGITQPSAGMVIYFLSTFSNSGPVFIRLGSGNYYELKRADGNSLKAAQLPDTSMQCLIFNGTSFIQLQPYKQTCPAGYTQVNEAYCIENIEHIASNFFNAVTTCYAANSRLCTWGEWYFACQQTGLGLVNMNNNYEWVETTGNSAGSANTVGSGNCTAAALGSASGLSRTFRCCYSLKK